MLTLLRAATSLPPTHGDWSALRAFAVDGPVAAGLDLARGLCRIALPEAAWGGTVGGFSKARSLALSPGGRWLAVGLPDSAVRLAWPGGEEDARDPVPSGVVALAIDADGQRAAAAGDGSLLVDTPDGWGRFRVHEARVVCIARRGDVVVAIDRDGRMAWVDLSTGKARVVATEVEPGAALLRDRDVLVGGADGTLRCWRPDDEALEPLGRVDGPITHLAEWGDGVAVAHGSVSLLTSNGRIRGMVPAHRGPALGLGLDEDASLWCASRGAGLRSLDSADLGPRPRWFGHRAGVRALLPHPWFDVPAIWTASRDGTLRMWSPDGVLLGVKDLGGPGLQRLVALPDERVLVADTGGALRIVDGRAALVAGPVLAHEGPVTAAGLLPDSGVIVTGGADGTLRCWEPQRLGPLAAHPLHDNRLRCLSVVSEDRVLTGSYDGTVAVVSPLTGAVSARIEAHERPVLGVLQADGRVWTASLDGRLRAWTLDGAPDGELLLDEQGLVALTLLDPEHILVAGKSGALVAVRMRGLVAQEPVQLGAPADGLLLHGGHVLAGDQRGGVHTLQWT